VSFFTWTQDLAIGVAEIDEQHQGFVALLNELFVALQAGEAPATIDAVVARLQRYTVEHFHFEEQLMFRAGYPRLAEHRELHRYFVEQLDQATATNEHASVPLSLETLSIMTHWLIEHIRGADHHAFRWIARAARPSSVPPR